MKVSDIRARIVFATNSQKTIEVQIETSKGSVKSSVPIGTSTGSYEVEMLPAEKALQKFGVVRRHFVSEDFANQKQVDEMIGYIDESPTLSDIGGNVALAISSAFLKAFALENDQQLYEYLQGSRMPRPICNVAGGWHKQDVQEFLVLPVHQTNFFDSMTNAAAAYQQLGGQLGKADKAFNFSKNLESGWSTGLKYNQVLDILGRITENHGLKIGLDFAATHLWDGDSYGYSDGSRRNRTMQLELMNWLSTMYPISYFEDPFHENDYVGFSTLTHEMYNKLVCGDDLFATSLERLKEGIKFNAASAAIVKPNQIGTISGVIDFVEEAKRHKIATVMSHRSGETDDTLICHLAVGLGCDYIKLGVSGERTVKINEMLRIEERLQSA